MSEIKRHFKSRFGKEGYLVEVDYSQLEIIALAYLSGDPTLRDDILGGVDMHCVRAAELYKVPFKVFMSEYLGGSKLRKMQRQIAKAFSFQLQYGAGATSMAKTNKTTLAEAKEFIENYYNRYPLILQWQKDNIQTVRTSRVYDGVTKTKGGYPSGTGKLLSPTGRVYTFQEFDNKYGRIGASSFSPTQIKNYPVQGFATADIVPMILGKIFRALKNSNLSDDFLMINTIHDSILFDCRDKEIMHRGIALVKPIMENAPKYLKEIFNIDFDLPLKVEVKYGPNWMEMNNYD